MKIEQGCEVTLDYELRIEGEGDNIIDKSQPGQPLKFTHGTGQIIPGLESQVEGMKTGEEKEVSVDPSDAYGTTNPKNIMDVPIGELPPDLPKHIGAALTLASPEGQAFHGVVTSATDEIIRVDFNHPLADKTLNFKIKVLEVTKQ
jgi:FKBP-type peptidyl-prolyl cis-trans isomerase 2